MRHFLLAAIRLYWRIVPGEKRRRCLFKESCSSLVYRVAKTEGFSRAIRAFLARCPKCRPGYRIHVDRDSLRVTLADGSQANPLELSDSFFIRE
jgi:putative component of membrane protein insertase Oxa1/YidC/SpoIIIJ protein YidD